MTDHCVIRADFSATRTIAGRKCLQLIFEVPIEAADDVLARLGGFPQPGGNRWCAIARLTDEAALVEEVSPQAAGGHARAAALEPERRSEIAMKAANVRWEKKAFPELPLTQQAGIRCADTLFQEFLKVETESDAASYVRLYCGVTSRSDLPAFPERWHDLEGKYQSWLTDRKFAEARR